MKILDKILDDFKQRVVARAQTPFTFKISQEAREFLLKEGTSVKHGARELKRVFTRHIIKPIASLLYDQRLPADSVLDITSNGRYIEIGGYCWPKREVTKVLSASG